MLRKGIVLGLIGMLTFSCVSKKKYAEMETLKNNVQQMLEDKNRELAEMEAQKNKAEELLKDCNDRVERLRQDSTVLRDQKSNLGSELDDLKATCAQLNDNYQQLKSQSSRKMQDLVDQLERLQQDLAQRERRLNEVEASLHKRDSTINAIEKRLAAALLGFKDKGLTVEVRDGKVYVSLSNKLLFASGSTKIDKEGQRALRDLANVLKEHDDITIMVEGHTDDVPVSNLGDIKDNWDLSVMRSTEVVRIIVDEGVDPKRIIPAGRGEYIPKVEGDSKEARASNRRTEIVISPKLDELFNLINESRE